MAESAAENFADRLFGAVLEKRSALVVGLDPVLERLPPELVEQVRPGFPGSPGYAARAAALFGLFCQDVIAAVSDAAVAVKANTAFFERFGPAGWDCLCQVCRSAKRAGLLVIADAKRGDIGHTAEAYAEALLGDLPDTLGPYVDAVTVNPYLGTDSVEPFLRKARERGKGLFVLVRTSNPSAGDLQDLDCGGVPLYLRTAGLVGEWGRGVVGRLGLSSVGAVVGATAPQEAFRVREVLPRAPFLVPGYGAQGGTAAELRPCFLGGGLGAVVNASRSVLFAYEKVGAPWRDAIRTAAVEARDDIEGARLLPPPP